MIDIDACVSLLPTSCTYVLLAIAFIYIHPQNYVFFASTERILVTSF